MLLGFHRRGRDHQHRPIGNVQQLVRDATEQRPDATEPARANNDLVGGSDPCDIGDHFGGRSTDQLCLIFRIKQLVAASEMYGSEQCSTMILAFCKQAFEVRRAKEVGRQLVSVHNKHPSAVSGTPSGHGQRHARWLRAVIANNDYGSAVHGCHHQQRLTSDRDSLSRTATAIRPAGALLL